MIVRKLALTLGMFSVWALSTTGQKTFGSGEAEKATGVDEIAREATVHVLSRMSGGPLSLGSGVWVGRQGYVATCLHLLQNVPPDSILIGVGNAQFYTPSITVSSAQYLYPAKILATDPGADVAILQTTQVNPLEHQPAPMVYVEGKGGEPTRLSVVEEADDIPKVGDQMTLTGYPLQGDYLILQFGNFAGVGRPVNAPGIKGARFLLSLTSNPGNSGGPVLNAQGKLVGLLEGNLTSPVKDEAQRPVRYVRPKRDSAGNLVLDQNGQPQFEVADLAVNSGISFAVPARFVFALVDSLQKKTN